MTREEHSYTPTIAAVSYDHRLHARLKDQGNHGIVHHWGQRAFSLLLRGGELVTLVHLNQGNGPGFICLDLLPGRVFGELRMRVGDSVHFVLPSGSSWKGPRAPLTVDLSRARPWRPPPFPPPPSRHTLRRTLENLAAKILIPPPRPPGGLRRRLRRTPGNHDERINLLLANRWDPFSRELVIRHSEFISSLKNRDQKRLEKSFFSLLGMGLGLTPQGDDFLAGTLAAGWWLKGKKTDAFLREELGRLIQEHGEATTLVSRHFLSEAAKGVFCEFVYRFLEALSAGEEKQSAAWVKWITGWGATSGTWFLFGFSSTASVLVPGGA